MGTNYYLRTSRYNDIEKERIYTNETGVQIRGIHIGKSSSGWCFSLHVYPNNSIKDLNDWKIVLDRGIIYNEYKEIILKDKMLDIIQNRSFPIQPKNDEYYLNVYKMKYREFLRANYAVEGPNNLLRHNIDNRFCIGHGTGTWDYLIGYFS